MSRRHDRSSPDSRTGGDGPPLGELGSGAPDAPPNEHPPLATWARTVLLVIGSLFLVTGLVGLALPVVPQAIPLILGTAMLSLASERLHQRIVRLTDRWPAVSRLLIKTRARLHRWLHGLGATSSNHSADDHEPTS